MAKLNETFQYYLSNDVLVEFVFIWFNGWFWCCHNSCVRIRVPLNLKEVEPENLESTVVPQGFLCTLEWVEIKEVTMVWESWEEKSGKHRENQSIKSFTQKKKKIWIEVVNYIIYILENLLVLKKLILCFLCDQQRRLRYLRDASYIHKMLWNLQSFDISLKINVGIIAFIVKSGVRPGILWIYDLISEIQSYRAMTKDLSSLFMIDIDTKFNVVLGTVSQIMRDIICDFLSCSNVRKMIGLGTFLLFKTVCNLGDLYI